MQPHHLLLPCALAIGPIHASTYSGMVQNLGATPLAGVEVKLALAGNSTITGANGKWSLVDSPSSIPKHSTEPIQNSGHLIVKQGRLQLSFGGMDILGRPLNLRSPSILRPVATARGQSSNSDTLQYFWRGKLLARTPVQTAQAGLIKRLDTLWSDDHGIPWNDTATYGTLFDSRNGKGYRTVIMGSLTWMAENLDYAVDSSFDYKGSPDSTTKYGRLYKWNAALGLPDTCNTKDCSKQIAYPTQGICPTGWHVPSEEEGRYFSAFVGLDPHNMPEQPGASLLANTPAMNLKKDTDADLFGFRGFLQPFDKLLTTSARTIEIDYRLFVYGADKQRNRSPLRCVKNTTEAKDAGLIQITVEGTVMPISSSSMVITLPTIKSTASIKVVPKETTTRTLCEYGDCNNFPLTDSVEYITVYARNGHNVDTYRIKIRQNLGNSVPWNPSIQFGTLIDSRDGKSYRTTQIFGRTWMAENLNFAADSSWLPFNSSDSGVKYGRYYSYPAALGLPDSCHANPATCSSLVQSKQKGICPTGWHIPSASEVASLLDSIHADKRVWGNMAGNSLKSMGYWSGVNGFDLYGFRAMGTSYRDSLGVQEFQERHAFIWKNPGVLGFTKSTAYETSDLSLVSIDAMKEKLGISVRCLKDE